MTRYYRRRPLRRRETLGAGLVATGLAAGVAAVSFYLVRLMLSREPVESPDVLDSTPDARRLPEPRE